MGEQSVEKTHTPINVYEMPNGGQYVLQKRIENGTAVLAFRVCEACAPQDVLDRIDDGELDLSDGDALDAQWPCEHVATPSASSEVRDA